LLVRFHDVSKSYGSFDVLQDVSFEIHPGNKIGLIGANGAGKTTLLGLLQTPDNTDSGTVTTGSGIRIGRLDQLPDFGTATVLEEALSAFEDLRKGERRLREMEEAMAGDQDPDLLAQYSALQEKFEFRGGYSYRARTEGALFGVGFTRDQFDQPANLLSGGEQNRLALARLLLGETDLLLLDEPTNHLDIRSIEWLESFLRATDKSLLIVSHDRFFLDRIVGRVLELENGRIYSYTGNYSTYVRQRNQRLELQEKEWQRQQEWIKKTQDYIERNIAGQKTKQAQSRRKALARIQVIAKPESAGKSVRFRFISSTETGRYLLRARALKIGYPTSPIIENVSIDVERGQRWAFVGPNGSGKTTLLRSLIGRLAPLSGELDWDDRLEVGYYDQQLEDLDPGSSVLNEIRSLDSQPTDGELRSFLAQFLFRGEDVFKQVSTLSGGERSKLALAKIIYASPPLLALDEPTNHLDIASCEALEPALGAYPGTIVFVTHDRRLVERIATHILYVAESRVRLFDRFQAFEEWLEEDVAASSSKTVQSEDRPKDQKSKNPPTTQLSKNRREQLEKEVHRLETQIEESENEIQKMESLFQESPKDFEWDSANRRYAELKVQVEELYQELAHKAALLD
jgi:ATP-binding cassette subfamily F protein 3